MMAIPIDRAEGNQGMRSWEYMTFDLTKPKKDIDGLNRLGREGWEAVSMVSSWGVGWRFVHPIVLLRRMLAKASESSFGPASRTESAARVAADRAVRP